jgi:hypothetical protein
MRVRHFDEMCREADRFNRTWWSVRGGPAGAPPVLVSRKDEGLSSTFAHGRVSTLAVGPAGGSCPRSCASSSTLDSEEGSPR